MNRVYGVTTLILVVLFLLSTLGGAGLQVMSADLDFFSLSYVVLFSLVYVFVLYLLAKRTLKIIRGEIVLSPRQDMPGQIGFYLGALLVVVAAVTLIGTTGLLIQLVLQQTSGVPVGMGYGLAIMAFVPGAALMELCKQPVTSVSQ
jgi:hypothetical protein